MYVYISKSMDTGQMKHVKINKMLHKTVKQLTWHYETENNRKREIIKQSLSLATLSPVYENNI